MGNVDRSHARIVYNLIDIDRKNGITASDMLTGFIRLRGSAAAVDLAWLMMETERMNTYIYKKLNLSLQVLSDVSEAPIAMVEMDDSPPSSLHPLRIRSPISNEDNS